MYFLRFRMNIVFSVISTFTFFGANNFTVYERVDVPV